MALLQLLQCRTTGSYSILLISPFRCQLNHGRSINVLSHKHKTRSSIRQIQLAQLFQCPRPPQQLAAANHHIALRLAYHPYTRIALQSELFLIFHRCNRFNRVRVTCHNSAMSAVIIRRAIPDLCPRPMSYLSPLSRKFTPVLCYPL